MTFDQALALLSVIGGIVASAITNLRGYRSVVARLKNYVTVDDYRNKVSTLHEEINFLRVKNAALERDVAHLLGKR